MSFDQSYAITPHPDLPPQGGKGPTTQRAAYPTTENQLATANNPLA